MKKWAWLPHERASAGEAALSLQALGTELDGGDPFFELSTTPYDGGCLFDRRRIRALRTIIARWLRS
jgi:hypothetical protein